MNSKSETASAAAGVARDSYGRLVALLAAADGDLPAAEDALADALERALRTWPDTGVPANPPAWLLTAARNRQRDRWRSAERRRTTRLDPERMRGRHAVVDPIGQLDPDAVGDRRLELMLVCAHPALPVNARAPLMLNTVLGFTAAQIARAFAMPTSAMATRLVRAKRRVKREHLPFRLPAAAEIPERMGTVLEAVYGTYVIEWSTTDPQARALPPEGQRLAEVLAEVSPDDPEVRGLAALVLLSSARAAARVDNDDRFVPLAEQDPARWNGAAIARAHDHLRAAYAQGSLGRFQLEAAIQATHCARRSGSPTNWETLKDLHYALHRIAPSRGSTTGLAAVLAETDGPQIGLDLLDRMAPEALQFQPAWATRAHLLARLGRYSDAVTAYDKAVALSTQPGERAYLAARRDDLPNLGASEHR